MDPMLMRALSLIVAATAALSACKKERAGATSEPAAATPSAPESGDEATASGGETAKAPDQAAPAGGEGSCAVTIEGAVSLKEETKDVVLGSTHWMTEEEIAESGVPGGLMMLDCRAAGAQVAIVEAPDSKPSDVPYGPKKYVVGEKPGTVGMQLMIGTDTYVATSGTLDVTRWDDASFAATFSAEATKAGAADKIKVTGTLAVPCVPGLGKCKK